MHASHSARYLSPGFHSSINFLVEDVCTLPKQTGPCKGHIEKFHYDSQTQRCLPFIYGGCRGNGNNFDNKEECQEACIVGK